MIRPVMANTLSAKKAVRSSAKKESHNLFWKRRIKNSLKNIEQGLKDKEDIKVLTEKLVVAQKVLDKASKEKVLHINRANRLKSKYASKISALIKPIKK